MKLEMRTTIIMLLIFTLSLIGSLLFTLGTVNYYNLLNSSYGVKVSYFPPYLELLYIVVSILVFTGIVLLLIKLHLTKIITIFFIFVSALVLLEFFDILLSPLLNLLGTNIILISLAASILLTIYYFGYADNMSRNTVNVIIFITIGAIVSLALGAIPSLILIGVIGIYDYIAVFVTKHMITLANGLTQGSFLAGITLAAKTRIKRFALLGGGDIVFPAIFINAVALSYSTFVTISVLIAAVLGLSLILFFGKKGKAYPAMAVIAPLQILAFGVCLLIKFI